MKTKAKRHNLIYIEVNPDTDDIVQIHWSRGAVLEKYSSGTMSRVDRVTNRYIKNTGVLIKGNIWAKIPYRKDITIYEITRRALDQTRDLKLRYLFYKLANRNIKDDIDKAHTEDFIEKIKIYFKKL